jgi:hypothetical protein
MPLNGEYRAPMMKIAPDAARAHTISVTIIVALDGANPTRWVTAEPLLPLGLTVFSLEQLLTRIVKILF